MALINAISFESGANDESTSTVGTFSVQTTIKRSGNYALRVNPSGALAGAMRFGAYGVAGNRSLMSVANAYTSVFVYFASLPSAGDEIFYLVREIGATTKFSVAISSTGTVNTYDTAGALLTAGSVALSTGVWYRFDILSGTGVAANWSVNIYNDPVSGNGTGTPTLLETLSGTGNLHANNNAEIQLGRAAAGAAVAINFFYDDLIVADTAFIGDQRQLMAVPEANGSTQQWLNGTGASDYQEVDEIPASSAEYVENAAVANQVALFDFPSAATIGVSGTIHCVKAQVFCLEPVAVASDFRVRIRTGGQNSDNTGANIGTTQENRGRLRAVSPNGGGAWTTADIDDLEVGAIQVVAQIARITAVYAHICFTPAYASASQIKTYNGIAIGSVKTVGGLAVASAKTINGITNV